MINSKLHSPGNVGCQVRLTHNIQGQKNRFGNANVLAFVSYLTHNGKTELTATQLFQNKDLILNHQNFIASVRCANVKRKTGDIEEPTQKNCQYDSFIIIEYYKAFQLSQKILDKFTKSMAHEKW